MLEFIIPSLNLLEFFSSLNGENRLLSAVFHDLRALVYRVGCKALGALHKKVTGPLWRKMVEEKYAINMTIHYQNMVKMFENGAKIRLILVWRRILIS